MPKVTKTTARKDNPKACPQAKAGQVYYWWRTRMKGARSGITRCSLTPPKPSQLTMSAYYAAVYELQEEISAFAVDDSDSAEDGIANLETQIEEWAERAREIGSEQQEKLDNMPDGLQQGDVGMLLEERSQACETWADEIDALSEQLPDPAAYDGDDLDSFWEDCQQVVNDIAALSPE